MTDAREEILARIRDTERGDTAPVRRTYLRRSELKTAALAERFAERVADYQATSSHVAENDVGIEVERICSELRIARLGVPAGVPAGWRPGGIDVVEDVGLGTHELDDLDGVLTGCTVAIAETGTIALAAGQLEGRRALTLVPDRHICVVRVAQIVGLVTEAIAVLKAPTLAGSPVTLVSGPSATSDIELDRVEGVHGPRTLVVLIAKSDI